MNILMRVFDQMARMGLAFRADPIRVIETEGREWGSVVDGMDMSIALRKDQSDLISVILRNVDAAPKTIVTGGWLHFLKAEINAPLSQYGRQALDPGRVKSGVTAELGPNEMIETELPLGILYDLSAPGTYQVRVSCQLPGGVLTSNECLIKHG